MQMRIRKARKKNQWEKDDLKARMVLGVGFLLLVFCAVWGEFSRQVREIGSRNTAAAEMNGWILGELKEAMGLDAGSDAAEEKWLFAGNTVLGEKHIEMKTEMEGGVTDRQKQFLEELERQIAVQSLHQAARQLWEERDELQAVWNAGGQRVLYVKDGEMLTSMTGMGLAVRGDGICFYGNFYQGMPEGVCTAIRYLNRQGTMSAYEYSMGIWRAGRMDGLGMTGKCRFSVDGKGQTLEEQVSGVFQADRMDGQLTYQQIDRRGRTRWWEIAAEEGKTCLDKRWVLEENLAEYRLLSERDDAALFVLPQNQTEQIWWENRVPWVAEP